MAEPKKVEWEEAYDVAKKAVEHADKVVSDLAGWSGASGHWPLQACSVIVSDAHKLFDQKEPGWMLLFSSEELETLKSILMWTIDKLPQELRTDALRLFERVKKKG